MKIYKYRSFTNDPELSLLTIEQLVLGPAIWCSKPESFNDRWEFSFRCDFTPTSSTISHLASTMLRTLGRRFDECLFYATQTVLSGQLEKKVSRHLKEVMALCRREAGVACFSMQCDNETMWSRYGGGGDGICVEIEVPDDLYNPFFYRVEYVKERIIHIDSILQATSNEEKLPILFKAMLATKTINCISDSRICWQDEQEVRYIAKVQDQLIELKRSAVTRIILGEQINPRCEVEIRRLIDGLDAPPIIEKYRPAENAKVTCPHE